MNSHDNSELDKTRSKKPYRSPVIQVYGNVRTMTHATGMATMLDGMATGNTKTA